MQKRPRLRRGLAVGWVLEQRKAPGGWDMAIICHARAM